MYTQTHPYSILHPFHFITSFLRKTKQNKNTKTKQNKNEQTNQFQQNKPQQVSHYYVNKKYAEQQLN